MRSGAVAELFEAFNSNNIEYCHWKSTDHLEASFEAKTDLDVLIGKAFQGVAEAILIECGFLRMRTPDLRTYPGVEDFIKYDCDLGRFVHLHLHYSLQCGDRWVKSYRVPIESYLLRNRVYLKEFGLWNIDPLSEYLLFIVRMHMKWTNPENKTSVRAENESILALLSEGWVDAVKEHPLITQSLIGVVKEYSEKNFSNISKKQKRSLQKENIRYQRLSTLNFWCQNKIRFIYRVYVEIFRRFLKNYSFGRRRLTNGGVIVAFVGMDGSGKTTMLQQAYERYSKQMNVTKVFLGTGRSGSGLVRRVIFYLFDSIYKARSKNISSSSISKVRNRPSLFKLLWMFLCLKDRNSELKKLCSADANGSLVLVDRWPQDDIAGFADARKLKGFEREGGLLGFVARIEEKFYRDLNQVKSDCTIWLDVSPEISLKRKPEELTIDEADKYRDVLKQLSLDSFSNLVRIDADAILSDVSDKVNSTIWKNLSGN